MVFKGQPVKKQNIQQSKNPNLLLMGPFKIDRQAELQKPLFQPYNTEWTVPEIAKYAAFALQNKKQMEECPHSLLWGLYKEMSSFIVTRNFRQCKNFHSRRMREWKKINGIVEHYKTTLDSFWQQFRKETQNVKIFYQKKEQCTPKNDSKQNVNKAQLLTSANYQMIMADTNLKEYSNPFRMQINDMSLKEPMFIAPSSSSNKSLQQQWLQCHQLFLQWTQRLKQLNQMIINF